MKPQNLPHPRPAAFRSPLPAVAAPHALNHDHGPLLAPESFPLLRLGNLQRAPSSQERLHDRRHREFPQRVSVLS